MSVDHLERAAKDARREGDGAVQAAIADTRTLAGEMVKGVAAAPDEITKVSEELERAITRLGSTGSATMAPCPRDGRRSGAGPRMPAAAPRRGHDGHPCRMP